MNIAVISAKDLFRYILKFFIIIIIISVLIRGIKGATTLTKEQTIKQAIEDKTKRNK